MNNHKKIVIIFILLPCFSFAGNFLGEVLSEIVVPAIGDRIQHEIDHPSDYGNILIDKEYGNYSDNIDENIPFKVSINVNYIHPDFKIYDELNTNLINPTNTNLQNYIIEIITAQSNNSLQHNSQAAISNFYTVKFEDVTINQKVFNYTEKADEDCIINCSASEINDILYYIKFRLTVSDTSNKTILIYNGNKYFESEDIDLLSKDFYNYINGIWSAIRTNSNSNFVGLSQYAHGLYLSTSMSFNFLFGEDNYHGYGGGLSVDYIGAKRVGFKFSLFIDAYYEYNSYDYKNDDDEPAKGVVANNIYGSIGPNYLLFGSRYIFITPSIGLAYKKTFSRDYRHYHNFSDTAKFGFYVDASMYIINPDAHLFLALNNSFSVFKNENSFKSYLGVGLRFSLD